VGAVGALAPDLDVLIRSQTDPLLAIEHHRGFTHSLAFIPVGGVVAALPWLARRRARAHWRPILGAATLGYATHGLLDACTTYGTQLFWPVSSHRVAWNMISIIDPLFTLVLFVGVVSAVLARSRAPALVALALCAMYLGLGALQRERALEAQERIAQARGHARLRGEVFPAAGNNLVWRSVYRTGDGLYWDRIRVSWPGAVRWSEGTALAAATADDLPPDARDDARVLEDFRRFRWFSGGWTVRAPGDPSVIADGRYSLRTDTFDPIWGVRFHPGRPVPTDWVDRSRERSLPLRGLWAEVAGTHPAYRPLPPPAKTR
jgi:inner membrane protein